MIREVPEEGFEPSTSRVHQSDPSFQKDYESGTVADHYHQVDHSQLSYSGRVEKFLKILLFLMRDVI
jgi:hypothetical protein